MEETKSITTKQKVIKLAIEREVKIINQTNEKIKNLSKRFPAGQYKENHNPADYYRKSYIKKVNRHVAVVKRLQQAY